MGKVKLVEKSNYYVIPSCQNVVRHTDSATKKQVLLSIESEQKCQGVLFVYDGRSLGPRIHVDNRSSIHPDHTNLCQN